MQCRNERSRCSAGMSALDAATANKLPTTEVFKTPTIRVARKSLRSLVLVTTRPLRARYFGSTSGAPLPTLFFFELHRGGAGHERRRGENRRTRPSPAANVSLCLNICPIACRFELCRWTSDALINHQNINTTVNCNCWNT